MDFREYLDLVLFGRLGLLSMGLVFFLSTILAIKAVLLGVNGPMIIVIWLGPPIVYQLITGIAATALWLVSKDWNDE